MLTMSKIVLESRDYDFWTNLAKIKGDGCPDAGFFKTSSKIQICDQKYSLMIGERDASKKSDVLPYFSRKLVHFLWCISEMARLVLKSQ